MSQISVFLTAGNLPPSVALLFVADTGSAVPAANTLNILGGTGIATAGSGNTITVSLMTPVSGQNGGTGVANTGKTITLGGNLTTSGAFNSTFTMTGTTSVTFPTSGTLLSSTSGGFVISAQGTANQVLVNGTSGSAQSGAITLTLPQNIDTSASPQFSGLTLVTAGSVALSMIAAGTSGATDITMANNGINNWRVGSNLSNSGNSEFSIQDQTATNQVRFQINLSGSNGAVLLNPVSGSVVIGTTTPIASAILTVTSTTQGLLPPRMTTTQKNAISSPAAGLTVYDNVVNDLEFWNGSAWVGTSTSGVVSITGTANQVLANGTSGSAQTGAVTLTLPQSIATSSAVQFGTVGIGSSVVTPSILSLTSTTLGFLPPRMTTTQKNAISAIAGLVVYDNVLNFLQFYNGSSWVGATGVTSWQGTANQIAPTTATTGAVTASLTNGISLGTFQAITPSAGGILCPGFVGIGTSTPNVGLVVRGGSTSFDNSGIARVETANPGTGGSPRLCFGISNTTNAMTYSWIQSVESGVAQRPLLIQDGGQTGFNMAIVPVSTVDITGNLTVGASYAGASAAPTNGVIIQGVTGMGLTSPPSTVQLTVSMSNSVPFGLAVTGSTNQDGSKNVVLTPTFTTAGNSSSQFAQSIEPLWMGTSGQTLTSAYSLRILNTFNTLVGTVTNAYGLYIDPGTTNTGTVTTAYGIYCNTPLHGTTKICAFFTGPIMIGVNTTGSGTALLGAANCPAVTLSAPYNWLKFISPDGSTVYIPCWK